MTDRPPLTPDEIRSYFRGNMFDGDEGGVLTAPVKSLLDECVLVVGFILEDLELIPDAHEWVAL